MREHKYGAKPTIVDGIRFASQKEARRYQELKLLEKAGEIRGLRLQPHFTLMAPVVEKGRENINHGTITGMRPIGEYRGDFAYVENGYRPVLDREVVEDVKGFKTPLYKWKKKHVEAQYGIKVIEV